jgi:hypothetical protein
MISIPAVRRRWYVAAALLRTEGEPVPSLLDGAGTTAWDDAKTLDVQVGIPRVISIPAVRRRWYVAAALLAALVFVLQAVVGSAPASFSSE